MPTDAPWPARGAGRTLVNTVDQELDRILGCIARALAPLPEVQAALLFGSRASGRARRDSDVDVAVLLDRQPGVPAPRAELRGLLGALTDGLSAERIDLVILNDAPPMLAFQVMKHGVVAFERTPSPLHAFRVRTYAMHADREPVERFFRGVTRARALGGAPRA